MKMSLNTPKQEHKSAEYDDAPSRAAEYHPEAPGYEKPYSKDQVKTSEMHPDHSGSGDQSYSQEEKYADYARYREQDRVANASNVQGEFAGYDMPEVVSAEVDTTQVLVTRTSTAPC